MIGIPTKVNGACESVYLAADWLSCSLCFGLRLQGNRVNVVNAVMLVADRSRGNWYGS